MAVRLVPEPACWRKLYDRAERAVGRPLESAVETPAFAAALAVASQVRAELVRRCSRLTGAVSSVFTRGLHMASLPAVGDIRHMHRDIVELDGQVRELSHRLDEALENGGTNGGISDSSRGADPDPRGR